jgi:hypothetical protein
LSFAELARTDAATRLGVLPVWSRPEALNSTKPVVVAIQGLLAGPDDLSRLPGVLGQVADAAVVRLPGAGVPALADPSLAAMAEAIGEAIGRLFPNRPVVLLGVSIGAVVALAVRAPSLRRIVAIEPPLRTAELWPLDAPLRRHLAARPLDVEARSLFGELFGVTAEATTPRDYLPLLDALDRPADVLLGGQPLAPPRRLDGFPSLVDAAARARLAACPRVRLHLAPGAGHNLQAQAPKLLRDVLFEACRRAAAEPLYDVRQLDEPLVEATPITAARALHWGPGGRAFAGAFLSWNPTGQIALLGEHPEPQLGPADPPAEVIALGAPPPPGLLDRLASRLAPGGHLVARWAAGAQAPAAVRQELAAHGLVLREPVDAAGTGVLRAQKLAPGPVSQEHAPEPALQLETVSFAHYLMDVRCRLPVRGLRTDPELAVRYALAPYTPSEQPADAPKVLVLQRPGPMGPEQGRRLMAYAIARGWVVVIEYDDHPGLVAEALHRTPGSDDLLRFGYAHAIQTTTEPLRDFFRAYSPEVRIFENAVFELAPFPAEDRPRRVFYGAVSRGAFGETVARALAPAVARFPDTEFVVLGDRAVFDALPTACKTFEPYLPYEAYLARMAGCAVSLSPIEALPLRETKSDAKFLDAARAGVVTIASPVIYERTIRHGENGLLAREIADWAPLLVQALGDLPLRRAIARRAWEEVRDGRMFAHQVAARRDWYRDLWARRAELDAAALARIPGLADALAAERAGLQAAAAGR